MDVKMQTYPLMSLRYSIGARLRRPIRPGSFSSVEDTPVRIQSSMTSHILINYKGGRKTFVQFILRIILHFLVYLLI